MRVFNGKNHPVDSKDVAFSMAVSKDLKAAFEKGGVKLLDPVYEMEIVVPTDVMGDILGDVNSWRGHVLGMAPRGKNTVTKAVCPIAEIQHFAPDLRGITGGKYTFTMELVEYENVPGNLVKKIVADSSFRLEDDV